MLGRLEFRYEHRVALAVGLLCIAVIGASTAGAVWISSSNAADRISKRSANVAGQMARALDNVMFERFNEIAIISSLGPFRKFWRSDPTDLRDVLDTLQKSLPTYSWIGLASPDGIVRAATGGMLEGTSVEKRPWFKAGLKGPAAFDVHPAELLSKLLKPAATNEPFRFVDVTMPVRDENNNLIGALGAHLSWNWADEVRKTFRETVEVETEFWVLSSQGKVLLGPNLDTTPYSEATLARMKAARRGSFEDASAATKILTGFAVTEGMRDYHGLGWIVVARTPNAVAYAPFYLLVHRLLLWSSILALIAMVFAWIVARRTAAPVRRLTAAVQGVGRDPTMTTLPWLGGGAEFIELLSSLRSLIRRAGVAELQLTHAEERHDADTRRYQEAIDTLRDEADHDALTGLLNRRSFVGFAEDAFSYYRRYKRVIAIFMIDIDHFKNVNDRYGHAAGDAMLRAVAGVLDSSSRKTDKVARLGGEEFVLLLHEISKDDLLALAERILHAVAQHVLPFDEQAISVTVSIGAALVSNGDADIQALIERADRALYAAKKGGRNCVRFAPQARTDLRDVA